MAVIRSLRGIDPHFGANCFLAETAVVVGGVTMGDNCTVWFNAVVRGDVHSITIGDNTNSQDGAITNCTYQKARVVTGKHGCTIEDNVLVGMGAIIMDGAVIGENSVVAAGAVVLAGTKVESGSIYAGMPAKKIKDIGNEMRETIVRTARNYPMYAEWYK